MAKSRRRLPKKTQKAVDKELRKWYRQIGDSYFERTQQTCPEVTGQLKDSGRIVHHRGGQSSGGAPWTVMYEAPYAEDIESGTLDVPNFDYKMKVQRHKRRTSSGKTVWVKAHTKQYHDSQRPAKIGNGWAIVQIGNYEGTHWQENAWTGLRKDIHKSLRNMLPKTLTRVEL